MTLSDLFRLSAIIQWIIVVLNNLLFKLYSTKKITMYYIWNCKVIQFFFVCQHICIVGKKSVKKGRVAKIFALKDWSKIFQRKTLIFLSLLSYKAIVQSLHPHYSLHYTHYANIRKKMLCIVERSLLSIGLCCYVSKSKGLY